MSGAGRLIVCTVREDGGPLELPGSRIDPELTEISGGERSLYELAVAAASLGVDVELRGGINGPILDTIADAAGARPSIGLDARRPTADDIVVVPETVPPHLVATAVLSEARWVLALLAPPGLWGTSFLPGWTQPDPHTVPIEQIGRPESFRAIAELGFAMWTNARGTAEAGERAGCPVTWLGTGTPVPFPGPVEKTHDVAVVLNNRWADSARAVVARLGDVSVLEMPRVDSTYRLSAHLAPARILVWPSRIEGMSRVAREARGAGTVVVSLDTNPFATSADHGGGVVLVEDLDQLARETRALLDDPVRLQKLSEEAAGSAREQSDWDAYRDRVALAVDAMRAQPVPTDAHLRELAGNAVYRLTTAERDLHTVLMSLKQQHVENLEAHARNLEHVVEHERARAEAAERGIEEMQSRRVVRAADAVERQVSRARRVSGRSKRQ